jgi:signal transduction histidine kinase
VQGNTTSWDELAGRVTATSADFREPTGVALSHARLVSGSTATAHPATRAGRGRSLRLALDRLGLRRGDHRKHSVVADVLRRERQRIAADVHDLVMQDLAFALASARGLADDPAHAPHASAIVAAGERALSGARSLVGELLDREDRKPVVSAVRDSAYAAARRTPLRFDAGGVPAGGEPDRPTLDTLVHIAREAVTNAVKHARPSSIEVSLEHDGDEWWLRVRDDGRGFDADALGGADAPNGEQGFGLQSMRRHAQALGGSLRVSSSPESGTTVEVILP